MNGQYSEPEVFITKNRNRLKNVKSDNIKSGYKNNYFLENGDNFAIEIFNKNDNDITAKIFIHNKSISDSDLLIKAGQRVFIDRFNDNTEFKFHSYISSNKSKKKLKEAKDDNGVIRIEFYNNEDTLNDKIKFKEVDKSEPYKYTYYSDRYNPGIGTAVNITWDYNISDIHAQLNSIWPNIPLEGVIIKGNKKGGNNYKAHEYTSVINYNNFYTYLCKILPKSEELIDKSTIEKYYCKNCNKKLKRSFSYCPNCGTKKFDNDNNGIRDNLDTLISRLIDMREELG